MTLPPALSDPAAARAVSMKQTKRGASPNRESLSPYRKDRTTDTVRVHEYERCSSSMTAIFRPLSNFYHFVPKMISFSEQRPKIICDKQGLKQTFASC